MFNHASRFIWGLGYSASGALVFTRLVQGVYSCAPGTISARPVQMAPACSIVWRPSPASPLLLASMSCSAAAAHVRQVQQQAQALGRGAEPSSASVPASNAQSSLRPSSHSSSSHLTARPLPGPGEMQTAAPCAVLSPRAPSNTHPPTTWASTLQCFRTPPAPMSAHSEARQAAHGPRPPADPAPARAAWLGSRGAGVRRARPGLGLHSLARCGWRERWRQQIGRERAVGGAGAPRGRRPQPGAKSSCARLAHGYLCKAQAGSTGRTATGAKLGVSPGVSVPAPRLTSRVTSADARDIVPISLPILQIWCRQMSATKAQIYRFPR